MAQVKQALCPAWSKSFQSQILHVLLGVTVEAVLEYECKCLLSYLFDAVNEGQFDLLVFTLSCNLPLNAIGSRLNLGPSP